MISLYNSLSDKKEVLPHTRGKELKLFVCGPTVYDYSHIGHGRTYMVFDLLVRYLRATGLKIFYLQNITDIDDKIIVRAAEERKSPKELADFFSEKHLEDMKALGIHSVTKYAPATAFIEEIVKQVQTLITKGYAYEIPNDGYYFDISKFKEYGALSGRTVTQAEDGVSRIDESIHKKNKGDFCLWKFSKPDEPLWKTPLGNGRPGWHIEDTAITEKFFGPQYDIHGGSLDLKFPHHEAEIAQQESASGKKPFVKIWMHTGFLLVSGKKMSKSLKNFITIRDFLKQFPAEIFRFLVLSHQYSSPMDYSSNLAEQAKVSFQTIKDFLYKLDFLIKKDQNVRTPDAAHIQIFEKKFADALEDDFNTPKALAAMFDLLNAYQKHVWSLDAKFAQTLTNSIRTKLEMFGFEFTAEKIPATIEKLAADRELSRTNKQFMQADALRKKINSLGYEVEDTPLGPLIRNTSLL